MIQGIAPTGMSRKRLLLLIWIALLGCGEGASREARPRPREPGAKVVIAGSLVECEVVDTPQSRALGLSGRDPLREGSGMLFVFERAGRHSFWMKGMRFDIDIIWIDGARIVHIARGKAPVPGEPLESYLPASPARYVLEVLAGTAETRGWTVGSPVGIQWLDERL